MPDKKTLTYLIIVLLAVLILVAAVSYYIFRTIGEEAAAPEKTLEERLQELTAPQAESLRSEEEQAELNELLPELTPERLPQTTAEEQQELEKVLRQLTP